MKYYRVVWRIEKSEVVHAVNIEQAQVIIENSDCVHDGRYVEDSFDIVKVEEVKE